MSILQMLDNWLDSALEHITARWLQSTLATSLPRLVAGNLSAKDFANEFTALLETRGLLTPAQQKNYRSNVTQALRSIDPHHPAIPLVALSTDTYRQLNDIQRGRLADAQTKFISSATVERLVERATELLSSAQWSEVGAGLAVLIGRRVSEILLSRFSVCSDWSILFHDPSKKSAELVKDFSIEIPTLAPAEVVLAAITKLQRALKIDDLKAASLSMKGAKQKINQRFSSPISNACNRHFAGMVESRADRDDLYSHLFRAVYATIAAHWFCPPNVPEHNFKAEIQGHFTTGADGAKLPNYSARANYDDYAIGTEDGNRDGRLGVKLGTLPGLRILAAFDPAQRRSAATAIEPLPFDSLFSSSPSTMPKQPARALPKRSSLRIDGDHHDRWNRLLHLLCPTGSSQTERTNALLDWAEQQLTRPNLAPSEPAQAQVIPELAKTLSWFTHRIEALEAEAVALQAKRDQLAAQVAAQAERSPQTQRLAELQAENEQLKAQLKQTQATLDNIRNSLGVTNGAATSIPLAVPTNSTKPTAPVTKLSQLADETSQATTAIVTPSRSLRPQRDSSASTAKVHQIIDAILSWNSAQNDSESMLRVSIPIVKAIGVAMGASYQQSIQQVLKERESELEAFHSRHMLGVRHNASVPGRAQILQAIGRDYLGLENWQEIH